MAYYTLLTVLLSLLALVLGHSGHHESGSIQYCKDEFCLAQTSFLNPSTSSHDLYFTLRVDGFDSAGHGWRGLGLGPQMEGALMFIIYGNPGSQGKPILSVRTTMKKHHPPLPLPEDYANGVEIQVVYAEWVPVGDMFRAKLNFICYNCTRWPGATIDATSKEQPWIHAHNTDQPFEAHSEDALLEMHSKVLKSGFGFFFVDMTLSLTESVTAPEFPTINSNKGSFGAASKANTVAASTVPRNSAFRHRAWQVHGLLLTLGYLVGYPLGVVLLRRRREDSFKLHWIVQVSTSACIALGMLLGIYLHPDIEHVHQVFGLVLLPMPLIQVLLGYRHHQIFMKSGRRTLFSTMHMTLGYLVIGMGGINICLGMVLKHWNAFWFMIVALVVMAETPCLALISIGSRQAQGGQKYAQLNVDEHEGAFALDDFESPLDDSDGGEKSPTMPGKQGKLDSE